MGAVNLGRATGRVWFEVEVLEAKGSPAVGFAAANFGVRDRYSAIGRDAYGGASWSVSRSGEGFYWYPPPLHTHSGTSHSPTLVG